MSENVCPSGVTAPALCLVPHLMCFCDYRFALASHFFWGLWSIIQAKISSIEFGYMVCFENGFPLLLPGVNACVHECSAVNDCPYRGLPVPHTYLRQVTWHQDGAPALEATGGRLPFKALALTLSASGGPTFPALGQCSMLLMGGVEI